MAASNGTISFDDMIQADRQRKKNEALAVEIFGTSRKNTAASNGSRKIGSGPSLANRVGIAKASQRSTSNTPKPKANMDSKWAHDLHSVDKKDAPRLNHPTKEASTSRLSKTDLVYETAIRQEPSPKASIQPQSRGLGSEYSIRGSAGPYVVLASNFAEGTTAADIESAMMPVGGVMQSCRILTATPTVIAEMVYSEKHNADNVVSTFNNKKADGRILYVHMKKTAGLGSTPMSTTQSRRISNEPMTSAIDVTHNNTHAYKNQREQQPDSSRRRADPEYQDGRYGFESQDDRMEVDLEAPAPVQQRDESHGIRRDDGRDGRRDDRYNAPRDYGRGRYSASDRGLGRPRDDRRLYSDNFSHRSRGRGFR